MRAPRRGLAFGATLLLSFGVAVPVFAHDPDRLCDAGPCMQHPTHRGRTWHGRSSRDLRVLGPAGAPPLGAAGPPALGAAGPPPLGAAGPPPLGAAGSLAPDAPVEPSFGLDGDQ